MINLYLLISLMILPKAYPDGVQRGPEENKYDRIYPLYQNQERIPFLSPILALSSRLLLATSYPIPDLRSSVLPWPG